MDKPWKVILAFVGVFAAGAIFGGLITLGRGGKWLTPEQRPEVVVTRPAATEPKKSPEKQPPSATTAPTVAGTTTAAPAPQAGAAQPAAPAPAQQRAIAPTLMRQLTQRLSPTPSQTKQIRRIVNRASEDIQRFQRDHLQDVARATDRMYEDVAAILSPEQQIQLEKMRQEVLERVRREQLKRGELQAKAGGAAVARRPDSVEGSNSPTKE